VVGEAVLVVVNTVGGRHWNERMSEKILSEGKWARLVVESDTFCRMYRT
jgi:hypothetical protein